jgi:hypothetical protein
VADNHVTEGWYLDPYAIHEQRWMSAGQPTTLVRDRGVEANDEPPDSAPPGPLVPAPVTPSPMARDLLRADDVDNEPSPDLGAYARVAMDENALLNNPLTAGVLPSGGSFETPFQRKLKQQARSQRWSQRWKRPVGHSPSPPPSDQPSS